MGPGEVPGCPEHVSTKLSSALPVFLVVVGLAFILLTFAFRTILVPVKSILGFLLCVASAWPSMRSWSG
jgi:RND superfamily putative drug exporter